jgi:hypothetical protein
MWRGHQQWRSYRKGTLTCTWTFCCWNFLPLVYALYRAHADAVSARRADSLGVNGELLGDFSLAACVRAEALKVGRFLHGLALNAAIFAAVGRLAIAGGMLAFPLFCCHKSSYLSSS